MSRKSEKKQIDVACNDAFNTPFRDMARDHMREQLTNWEPYAACIAEGIAKETEPGTKKSNAQVLDAIVPAYHEVEGILGAGRLCVHLIEHCVDAMREPSKEDKKGNAALLRDARRCLKAIEKSRDLSCRLIERFALRCTKCAASTSKKTTHA